MRTSLKCFFAAVITLMAYSIAFSATIDDQTAQHVAKAMIENHIANHAKWGNSTQPTIVKITPVYYKGEKIAYNAQVDPSGQLLISGSDLLSPVLLYSTSSRFDPDLAETSGSLESWIVPEVYNAFMKFEGQSKRQKSSTIPGYSTSKVAQAWSKFRSSSKSKVKLLSKFATAGPILSTRWDQSPLYNKFCPILDGQLTVVGCVATAWAQILNYWEWPDQGTGARSYYWSNGAQTLTESFNTAYDWDNMPDRLDSQSTPAEINAVAKLCYDAGISASMNYGVSSSGSSAYAVDSLPTFFKYKNTARYHNRSNYNATSWMDIIKAEFEAFPPRPIAFSIFSDFNGHEVVIDGYQKGLTDKVHINFGWSGAYDGYYDITQNFQAGETWNGSDQQIVVKLEPDKTESDNPWDNLPSNFYSFLTLTDNSTDFTLPSQCFTRIVGSTGNNTIHISPGARVILTSFPGGNTINFQEPSTNFTVFRSGATVYLTGSSNTTLVRVPASTTSQSLCFTDGRTLPLYIYNGQIFLSNQYVTTTATLIN